MEGSLVGRRYQLLQELGRGPLGEVYKAQDTLTGNLVAVKLLREELSQDSAFVNRLRERLQRAGGFSHPSIVSVSEWGQEGERIFLVREFVAGRSLRELLSSGPLPLRQALDIVISICSALGIAHRRGLVHGNLKPENVFLSGDVLKLTDFGLPMPSAHWGLPLYTSPEQLSGGRVGLASDVYSLGAMLYEMLAGRPPFEAEDFASLMHKHLWETPPPLRQFNPDVPISVEKIVHKTLAKEPSARYRNCEQMGYILAHYEVKVSPPTPPLPSPVPPVSQPPGEPQEGPDWLALLLGFIALAAVIGLVVLWSAVHRRYTSLPPQGLLLPLRLVSANGGFLL